MLAPDFDTRAALFDYEAEAELFPARGRRGGRQAIAYRRFARAADAIRFAIEEMPRPLLVGAYLEVGEVRFDSGEILRLYESSRYPLERQAAA